MRGKREGGGGVRQRQASQRSRGVKSAKDTSSIVLGRYGDSVLKTSRTSGGRRLLRPSTHTRAKYRQPHRLGGQPTKYRYTGQDTRGSMAPAASQMVRTAGGNRRYWGGLFFWSSSPSAVSPDKFPARASLSPPLASSLSVFRLFVVPPSSAGCHPPSACNCLAAGAMLPLVYFPVSQCLGVSPPRPVRLAVLGSGVGGGA